MMLIFCVVYIYNLPLDISMSQFLDPHWFQLKSLRVNKNRQLKLEQALQRCARSDLKKP